MATETTRLRSTAEHHGAVTVAIHWASAALVLALLLSGFRAAGAADPWTKAALLRVHAVQGAAVLALTLARLGWWALADHRRPAAPTGGMLADAQARAARWVHRLLYVLLLGMAASGIGMLAVSGAGAVLFGGAAGPLPDFWGHPPRAAHGAGARVLLLLIALHVGAALHHHLVSRDGLMARMRFAR